MHPAIARQVRRELGGVAITPGMEAVLDAASRALRDLERDRDVAGRTMDELSHELEERLESMRMSEVRYRTLFDMSPFPKLLVRRADLQVLGWNHAAERTFGWTHDEARGRTLDTLALSHGDRTIERLIGDMRPIDAEAVLLTALHARSGVAIDAEVHARAITLGDGESVLLTIRDLTDLYRAERSARESAARFSAFFDHAGIAIQVLSAEGVILEVNPACRDTLGYEADELLNRSVVDLLEAPDADTLPLACMDVAMGLRESAQVELPFMHKCGGTLWGQVTLARVHRDDDTRIMAMLQDVTERKRMERELERQAFQDDLTGLANRALFRDRLQHALERRTRTRTTVAVLLLDLDGFKRVNDSMGHAAGDELLRTIALRIANCVRASETVSRLGGDEFAIVVESPDDDAEAQQLGERLLRMVALPVSIGGREVVVHASIGIAVAQPGDDGDAVLRNADTAMYAAKAMGKQCVRAFDPSMHARAISRMELEEDLRHALANQEFVLYFQPLVNLQDGALRGFEALLRWRHPRRGLVSPAEFLPVAEDTGMIVALGRWVLREACARAATWTSDPHTGAPTVSVNLAARQLDQHDLLADVRDALTDSGLAPQRLIIEITESEVMRNPEVARDRLEQLRALGIRVAIDDFGTGYSSLSHLQYFPIDELKIDQSFVARIANGDRELSFVRTMVALAHSLEVEVVAEGIEQDAQNKILAELGCHTGQGYLYGRPLDPVGLVTYLARRAAQGRRTMQMA